MRIIQVGSGGWGESWLDYIGKNEACELVGVVSRDGSGFETKKKKYNLKDARCFASLKEGLQEEADLVIITVPHPWHIEYAKSAVEAGKNVLIEKPLSNNFKNVKEFMEFLDGRDEKVWVSQNFRFRENLWKLKASLGENGIGSIAWMDVLFKHGNTRTKYDPKNGWERASWRKEQFSLLIEEIAIHHFDIMRFLTESDAIAMDCKGFSPYWNDLNGEECVFAFIEFANGVKVNYSGSMKSIGMHTGWMGSYKIQTDKGCVQLTESEIKVELGKDEEGALQENIFFPGKDREGILNELKKGLDGQNCAVPLIYDNINSYAMVCAAELSLREKRPVALEELFRN